MLNKIRLDVKSANIIVKGTLDQDCPTSLALGILYISNLPCFIISDFPTLKKILLYHLV